MEITAIDEGDFYGSTLELLRGVQTAKATSQYDDTMAGCHSQCPSGRNPDILSIISATVIVSPLIRGQRSGFRKYLALAIAAVALQPNMVAHADDPPSLAPHSSSSSKPSTESSRVTSSDAPTVVIGFLGGLVRHDDLVHSEVQLAQRLRSEFPGTVHVATFENRRLRDAHDLILQVLSADRNGRPTEDEKRAARIILYGHSWGASAVVILARKLQSEDIPVLLTIQVDSIAKSGQDDGLIPGNVAHAVNFYQDKGMLRGRRRIRPADATRTEILGNFRFDYSHNPISCRNYPWYANLFMRSHIEIECDPVVWQRVEDLIREQLPALPATRASAR
jgi:hypothetical protein